MSRPVTAVLKQVSIFGGEVPEGVRLDEFSPHDRSHFSQ